MKKDGKITQEMMKNLRLRGRFWHVEIMVDGEPLRRTTKHTRLEDAIRVKEAIKLRMLEQAAARREEGPPVDTDFDDAASIYWNDMKDTLRADDEAERVLAEAVTLVGPGTMCSDVTAGLMYRIRTRLINKPQLEKKRGRPRRDPNGKLAPKTVNKCLEMILRVINHAESALPATFPHKPDPEKDKIFLDTTGRGRYLTEIDEHLLLEQCDQDTRDLIEFDLETGLRAGELVGATWDMLDVVEESITVPVKAKGLDPQYHTVYLSEQALAILDSRRGRSQAEHIFTFEAGLTYWRRGDLVAKGTLIAATYTQLQRRFQNAVEAAGLSDFVLHDLRRTAARRIFFEAGIEMAQAFLGHKDRKTTEDYLSLTAEDVKAAIRHRTVQQKERHALVKAAAADKAVPIGDKRVARIRAEFDRRARLAEARRPVV